MADNWVEQFKADLNAKYPSGTSTMPERLMDEQAKQTAKWRELMDEAASSGAITGGRPEAVWWSGAIPTLPWWATRFSDVRKAAILRSLYMIGIGHGIPIGMAAMLLALWLGGELRW